MGTVTDERGEAARPEPVRPQPPVPGDDPGDLPATRITVIPGGPLLVRGDVEIVDPDGDPVPRRRRTVALCRCGRSRIQPYCDGSHTVGREPIRGEDRL